MARAAKINLRKRNKLIASITAGGGDGFNGSDVLTDLDRQAIERAYADERAKGTGAGEPGRRKAGRGGNPAGHDVLMGAVAYARTFLNISINIAPIFNQPAAFDGMSAARLFEELLRRERADAAGPVRTVDVRAFYDGNGDRGSVAPNLVDSDHGPTFEAIRDTLLGIADRPEVAAVGVEIHDVPDPEVRADDDVWLSAERVFIWTSAPAKSVREWAKPLMADGVGRENRRAAAPPKPLPKGRKVSLFSIGWD